MGIRRAILAQPVSVPIVWASDSLTLRLKWSRARKMLDAMVAEMKKKLLSAYVSGGHQKRGGDKWAPLSPATIKRKRGFPFPGAPLVRTGKMGNSGSLKVTAGKLRLNINRVKKYGKIIITRGSLSVTVNSINTANYSGFHQTGTTRHPPREPIEYTDQDIKALEADLKKASLEL